MTKKATLPKSFNRMTNVVEKAMLEIRNFKGDINPLVGTVKISGEKMSTIISPDGILMTGLGPHDSDIGIFGKISSDRAIKIANKLDTGKMSIRSLKKMVRGR